MNFEKIPRKRGRPPKVVDKRQDAAERQRRCRERKKYKKKLEILDTLLKKVNEPDTFAHTLTQLSDGNIILLGGGKRGEQLENVAETEFRLITVRQAFEQCLRYMVETDEWYELKHDFVPAVHCHSAVKLSVSRREYIILYGGFGTGTKSPPLNDLYCLRFEELRCVCFKLEPDGPAAPPRAYHAAAILDLNGCAVMITHGGMLDANKVCSKDQATLLFRFNIDEDKGQFSQSTSEEQPVPLHRHSAVAYDKDMYIFGGKSEKMMWCNILYRMTDLREVDGGYSCDWKVELARNAKHAPSIRDGHGMFVIDHCLWIFGGYTGHGTCMSTLLRVFPPEEAEAICINDSDKYWYDAVFFGSWMENRKRIAREAGVDVYAQGSSEFSNELFIYNLRTKEWTERRDVDLLTAKLEPRAYTGLVVLKQDDNYKLIAPGGERFPL